MLICPAGAIFIAVPPRPTILPFNSYDIILLLYYNYIIIIALLSLSYYPPPCLWHEGSDRMQIEGLKPEACSGQPCGSALWISPVPGLGLVLGLGPVAVTVAFLS